MKTHCMADEKPFAVKGVPDKMLEFSNVRLGFRISTICQAGDAKCSVLKNTTAPHQHKRGYGYAFSAGVRR